MKDQINKRLISRNIEMIGAYVNAKTPTTFISHDCGHTWVVAPDGVLQGTGCPACKNRKLVHGVGDNDIRLPGNDPIYIIWKSMLGRCYSKKIKHVQPTYTGISCCVEWYTLSVFRDWVLSQNWEGKQLDKDLLVHGNTEYSPSTCMFVTAQINSIIRIRKNRSVDLPRGVNRNGKKYQGGFNKTYLGSFDTPEEAHAVYITARNAHIQKIANQQTDSRIRDALLTHME